MREGKLGRDGSGIEKGGKHKKTMSKIYKLYPNSNLEM
jgi:hypothetical protein